MGNSTAVESKPRVPAETVMQEEEINELSSPENSHFRVHKGVDFGFNKINIHGHHNNTKLPQGIQTKLTINEPGDMYEQEADAMADKVMRMETSSIHRKPLTILSVQRKCANCKEDDEKETTLQRKEVNGNATETNNTIGKYVEG